MSRLQLSRRAQFGLGLNPAPNYYSDEARSLFARMTVKPTPKRAELIDQLYNSLVAAGVLPKLDALYVLAAADSQAAKLNWIANQYNLTEVNAPTFTADRGFAGDGSTSYLSTGFQPSTAAAAKMTLDNAHLSVWSRTDSAANVTDIGVSGGTAGTRIDSRRADGTCLGRVADTTSLFVAVPNSLGYSFVARSASNARRFRRATTASVNDTTASIALPNVVILVGALGGGAPANFSGREYAAASIGGNLSNAESDALYTALNTYLTAVGAA
jgi:hypothetical protein